MKILHCVESYSPALGGMQEVVKQLSERLAKMEHEVTVAARKHADRPFDVLNGVRIISFDISGNAVIGIKGDQSEYKDLLLKGNFDVITFFAAQQWATDLALPILDQIKAKKVFVPTGFSGLFWPDYKTYFENMKRYLSQFDMNVFLSNDYRDVNFAKENGVKKLCIIPNGAAEDEFLREQNIPVRKQLGLNDDTFLILHVGSFTSVKGHKEALEIFANSKLKNAALLFIGNGFENFKGTFETHRNYFWKRFKLRMKGNKVIMGSFDREFTVAAYKQSDLFLFPSNIECSPIVLFESAAAKLPFLATDVGNSVEIAQWTEGGKILPTDKDKEGNSHARIGESVDVLNTIYEDRAARKKMGDKAFTHWKEKFSWEKIAEQYADLYLNLIK
jgi:glycosyltransferase involved in cell wall biosynthesis